MNAPTVVSVFRRNDVPSSVVVITSEGWAYSLDVCSPGKGEGWREGSTPGTAWYSSGHDDFTGHVRPSAFPRLGGGVNFTDGDGSVHDSLLQQAKRIDPIAVNWTVRFGSLFANSTAGIRMDQGGFPVAVTA